MPRFFDPARYNEDWYIELRGEYQKLFDYIVETCDNAGVWKPNKFDFETKTGFKVNLDLFLKRVNGDKERVLVLENGRWFLPGFVKFQWFNKKSSFELNASHPFHINIIRSIDENKLQGLVKGLERVCQGVKDKDKEKKEVKTDPKAEEGIKPPPLGMDLVKSIARKVWDSQGWREQACMGLSIQPKDLQKWMALFNSSVSNDHVPNFDEGAYKKMIRGWISKQIEKGYKVDSGPKPEGPIYQTIGQ